MNNNDLNVFIEVDEVLGKAEMALRNLRDNDGGMNEEEHAEILNALKETIDYRKKMSRLSGEMIQKESNSIYDNWTQQIGKDKR